MCFKAFVRQHESTDVGKVAKAFGGIIVRNSALLARSYYKTINETERIANVDNLLERVEKFN